MAIVSSTYVKRRRNGGFDIIMSHTDPTGAIHNYQCWMAGDPTTAEIDARVSASADWFSDKLAEMELEELIND